ncbi:TetR/AcrR family transcriptional regulator [Streptomyces sp. NPDC056660]|uniref:TetR/AcrR family transcriptional regulator n=1 Tax=Streptomyces sp. NPDC056660 TaxID=3345897 RepID=UPI0036AF5C5B
MSEEMDQLVRLAAGRPPVPPDRIVAMALQIVDEEGAEALSMRALAERLGSGTATLYRHFANRAELVAQVVDHMYGLVELDDRELASASWQQPLTVVAHAMFRALGRHGNAARLLAEQIPVGPKAMALRERCVAVLLKAGFEASLATRAYVTLARYVCGLAIQLNHENDAGGRRKKESVAALRGVDPAQFPAVHSTAEALPVPVEEVFSFGLDLILRGLGAFRDGG